jgi:hypothetical protein
VAAPPFLQHGQFQNISPKTTKKKNSTESQTEPVFGALTKRQYFSLGEIL